MPKIEDAVKEKISKIVEKVNANVGQPVLSFRDFSFPGEVTGDFIPPRSEEFHHYEAGIIEGEVENLEKQGTEIIDLGNLSFNERHRYESYVAFGDQTIPVMRNLSGILRGHTPNFRFSVDTLEGLDYGNILIDAVAIAQTLYPDNSGVKDSYLRGFNLLIGKRNISRFLKERGVDSRELIETLSDPELVGNRIKDVYYNQGKKIVEDVLVLGSEIARDFREIKKLEKDVLSARYETVQEQDGVSRGWSERSYKAISKYEGLRGSVLDKLDVLKKEVQRGHLLSSKVGSALPPAEGLLIGFPGALSFDRYFSRVMDISVGINETVGRLNAYINEQVSKAR